MEKHIHPVFPTACSCEVCTEDIKLPSEVSDKKWNQADWGGRRESEFPFCTLFGFPWHRLKGGTLVWTGRPSKEVLAAWSAEGKSGLLHSKE